MIIDLVKPWSNTCCTVYADYYFASIPAVDEPEKIGRYFFGAVKTATRKYPMHFLKSNYLHERGYYKKLVSINEQDDSVRAVAIMWLDKNHQFFW